MRTEKEKIFISTDIFKIFLKIGWGKNPDHILLVEAIIFTHLRGFLRRYNLEMMIGNYQELNSF